MSVESAIRDAEWRLPGEPSADDAVDPRWQAIIQVGEYVETDPDPIWEFVDRWGRSENADLRAAVATCLLEHLLEHHFDLIFPRISQAVAASPTFADCFARTWAMGQSDVPTNRLRFDALKASISRLPANER